MNNANKLRAVSTNFISSTQHSFIERRTKKSRSPGLTCRVIALLHARKQSYHRNWLSSRKSSWGIYVLLCYMCVNCNYITNWYFDWVRAQRSRAAQNFLLLRMFFLLSSALCHRAILKKLLVIKASPYKVQSIWYAICDQGRQRTFAWVKQISCCVYHRLDSLALRAQNIRQAAES